MAPRRKIRSQEELGEKLIGFMDFCTENDMIPTDYQLCKYLGISIDTLERYSREPEKYQGYAEQLKKLVTYREDWFLQKANNNPKAATISIFALKQPKNGGYVDKPAISVDAKELKIITDGVGDGAFD